MQETGSLFLSLNMENGELPKRIMLFPASGSITGRDGRKWKKSDPKKIAVNSMARLSRLVIDENHSTDLSAPKGGASPAMGWMTNLCADDTGAIWADVDWTRRGGEAVLNKEYSFISPVFLHDDEGEVTYILRAGLTNSPNLQLPALNAERLENTDTEDSMNKELCAALGLPSTASEADVIAAVKALNAEKGKPETGAEKPAQVDLAAYAPRADLNAMEARAVEAEKKLAELNAAALKAEAEAVIDGAVKARKIAPASRAEYLALCTTKESVEKFKGIFSAAPEIIGAGAQAPEGTPPAGAGGAALNAEESALAAAMGYSVEEWQKIKGGEK
jgi:phage I-like protein